MPVIFYLLMLNIYIKMACTIRHVARLMWIVIHMDKQLHKLYYFGQTDSFPNTFHFGGMLIPSCVNRRYMSNVTRCLSYLKILHYKVLQDACHLLHIMTGIRSFLWKWHNTVIPLTDNYNCFVSLLIYQSLYSSSPKEGTVFTDM